MAGVNKVIILGHLGNDPEMRYMPNGEPVANLSIATSETWNDKNTGEKREKTEWHRVVAYRRTAEIIGQYTRKGSKLYVEGKLQTRKWTDNNGVDRYITEIGGVLKCMLINEGQTKSNGDTVYLSCANSNYRLLSPLPWTEYKAKRQIRQQQAKIPLQSLWQAVCW